MESSESSSVLSSERSKEIKKKSLKFKLDNNGWDIFVGFRIFPHEWLIDQIKNKNQSKVKIVKYVQIKLGKSNLLWLTYLSSESLKIRCPDVNLEILRN
jgi:hypothetical protein